MGKLKAASKRSLWALPRWYYALFVVLLTLQLLGSFLIADKNQRTQILFTKVNASMDSVVRHVQLYHLWLEEFLTDPTTDNEKKVIANKQFTQSSISELHKLIQRPDWLYADNEISPDYITHLEQQLTELIDLGNRRIQLPNTSGVDSGLDEMFDRQFILILEKANEFEFILHDKFDEHLADVSKKTRALLILGAFLAMMMWGTLIIMDRRRRLLVEKTVAAEKKKRERDEQYRYALEESVADKDVLLKQKEKLKLHFDQTPLGVIEWTPEFEVVDWNPAAERIFGFNAEEAIGCSATGLILNNELLREVESTKKELITQTGGYRSINHNITKDGRIILCDWYNTPLFDHDGETVGVASLVLDVTEQRSLEKSHRRLASMLENSTDFVGIADHEGHVLYINKAGRKMVGLAIDEAVEQLNMKDFHLEEELIRMKDDIFPCIAKEGIAIRENLTFVDNKGNEIPTSCVVMLETDENGDITHYMSIARDLREEKQAQAKLEHTQRLESLGVLAGGIAHDFNNILTGIIGNTALAANKLEINSPIRSYLESVEEGSHRAAELCKQMLAYSGKGKFIISVIDINQMVNEIVRLMEVSIHKGVVLKYHLAANLPMIDADAAQLQQVMMNLIINASEAIEGKSGVVTLSTGVMLVDDMYLKSTDLNEEVTLPGRYVYLEVSDTGCGMDRETQNKLFDPFFTTKFTGRGLGMSAILGIVRGHHGAIKCYSEKGKGTTFKVLFPCSEKSIADEQYTKQAVQESVQLTGTVLIVDDEETVREVAGIILEEMGFHILKAADGQEGVSVFLQKHEEINIIILDMTMPKMDGVEAFREMHRIDPKVKVILSSGYNEQDATNRFVGKGLAGFIQKPYLPGALQQIVIDVLNVDEPKKT